MAEPSGYTYESVEKPTFYATVYDAEEQQVGYVENNPADQIVKQFDVRLQYAKLSFRESKSCLNLDWIIFQWIFHVNFSRPSLALCTFLFVVLWRPFGSGPTETYLTTFSLAIIFNFIFSTTFSAYIKIIFLGSTSK